MLPSCYWLLYYLSAPVLLSAWADRGLPDQGISTHLSAHISQHEVVVTYAMTVTISRSSKEARPLWLPCALCRPAETSSGPINADLAFVFAELVLTWVHST